VIKKFADKYTGQIYKPGDKLNLKKDRIKEILSVDKFVEESKNEKETSK
jgi:hypothetical protein